MSTISSRIFRPKFILLIVGGLVSFLLLFVISVRITVMQIYRGIELSRETGLSAVAAPWDSDTIRSYASFPEFKASSDQAWVSRSANLQMRSSSFDGSAARLREIAAAHKGYFEDFRTESRSTQGRALTAILAVPSNDFDATLSDLKTLGRTELISQTGEDSAVKVATAARHLDATRTNLSRLQKLQRERKGELRDAVELEKDIAQANEAVGEAERQHDALVSTVALARIQVAIIEDYRAPLTTNLAGASLTLRNSLVDGVSAVFSPVSFVVGVLLEFGLPTIFWLAVLFWPARLILRRVRGKVSPLAAAD